MDSKAYYKLTNERNRIEEQLEIYNVLIDEYKTEAKKLKKGSIERQEMFRKVSEIQNQEVYKMLITQLDTINFCINIVFYN